MIMKYTVNNKDLHYETIGQKQWGKPVVLLDNDTDISLNTHWSEKGFTIERLFNESLFHAFQQTTYRLLTDLWKKASLTVPSHFDLSQYHLIAPAKEQHLAAVERTKLIDVNDFPVSIHLLENRIS